MDHHIFKSYWTIAFSISLGLCVVSAHATLMLTAAYVDLYDSVDYRQVVIYQNWFEKIGSIITTIQHVHSLDHITDALTIELPPIMAAEKTPNDLFFSMKGVTPFYETSYVVTSPYFKNDWVYVFAFDDLWETPNLLPKLPNFFKAPVNNIYHHRYGYIFDNPYVTRKPKPHRYNENSPFYVPLENKYVFAIWTPQLAPERAPVKKEEQMTIDYSNPFFNFLTRIRDFFYQPWLNKKSDNDDET